MTEFNKLRKRVDDIVKERLSPSYAFNKSVESVKKSIDSQERYYNNIPASIKTSNTLMGVLNTLEQLVKQLSEFEKPSPIIEDLEVAYLLEKRLRQEADDNYTITAAYLQEAVKSGDACIIEKAKAEKDLIDCNTEKQVLETTNKELNTKITELNDDITKLTEEKTQLTNDLNECRDKNNELLKFGERMVKIISEKETKIAELEAVIKQKTDELLTVNRAKDVLTVNRYNLESEVMGLESEIKEHNMKENRLTKELDEKNTQLDTLKEELQQHKSELTNMTNEYNKTQELLNDNNNKVTELLGNISTLESEITTKKAEFDSLTTDHAKVLADKDIKIKELEKFIEEQKTEYSNKISELESEKGSIIAKRDELQKSLSELENNDSELKSKLQTANDELSKFKTVTVTNETNKLIINEKNAEIDRLKEQLLINKDSRSELDDQVKDCADNIILKDKEIEGITQENQKMNKEIDNILNKIKEKNSNLTVKDFETKLFLLKKREINLNDESYRNAENALNELLNIYNKAVTDKNKRGTLMEELQHEIRITSMFKSWRDPEYIVKNKYPTQFFETIVKLLNIQKKYSDDINTALSRIEPLHLSTKTGQGERIYGQGELPFRVKHYKQPQEMCSIM